MDLKNVLFTWSDTLNCLLPKMEKYPNDPHFDSDDDVNAAVGHSVEVRFVFSLTTRLSVEMQEGIMF